MVVEEWAQVEEASGASADSWALGEPVALGLVPASTVKDGGQGFQWEGLDLNEAVEGLLDEAQGSGQGQGTNFSPGSGFPGAAQAEAAIPPGGRRSAGPGGAVD